MSVIQGEGCFSGQFVGILDIDPATGVVSTFADNQDGLCGITGLTFTPDGQNLLVASTGEYGPGDLGWVRSFSVDGSSTIFLDGEDGLYWPSGFNCLAYDHDAALYVLTGENELIMRYLPDGTSEAFADVDDRVVFQGSIAVAPNGNVFFCSHRTDEVVKITPDGIGTLFDIPPTRPWAITVDRKGNLYIGSASTEVYRYEGALAMNRELVASGNGYALRAIALSPDERTLYAATGVGLYRIDIETGAGSPITTSLNGTPYGIAVHINYAADLDVDRDIDLADFAVFSNCPLDLNNDDQENITDVVDFVSSITGP